MAFLTKKEQAVIREINNNEKLLPAERLKLVQNINYTARLRQDGYRLPVREFIRELANFQSDNILKSL